MQEFHLRHKVKAILGIITIIPNRQQVFRAKSDVFHLSLIDASANCADNPPIINFHSKLFTAEQIFYVFSLRNRL